MRLAALLLGVTAMLLASVNADASVADTKAFSQGNAGKRFLRSDEGNKLNAEEGAEERAFVKLSSLDRLNTYLTPGAKLPSGVKLTDIDRMNTRLTKSDKLSSGVKLTNADRLNTRLTNSADLQKLKYAIKLKKRLKTRLTQRLNRNNA